MLRALYERVRQKHRTIAWPKKEPVLPDRFRGRPSVDFSRCPDGCDSCGQCPTGAIAVREGKKSLDMGRCLFCAECVCPNRAVSFTNEYKLGARDRDGLLYAGGEYPLVRALDKESKRLFGRSLKLRQVSAGGCNACEADVNVLGTVVFDLGRFGVQFVASPRHADGLLITGPVSKNMKLALEKTYAALPAPKIVIAVGACAISGGPYIDHPECCNGASSFVPVDLFIPGCPPHPMTTLDGIVRLLGKMK